MNTAEKVITALKGSREERAILIRDPNRIVSTAVLGSPKLTDAEIERFAAMKNVSDEVLRTIGTHQEWTKKYPRGVEPREEPAHAVGISLGMVSRLNPRDMKIDDRGPQRARGHPQAGGEVHPRHGRTAGQEELPMANYYDILGVPRSGGQDRRHPQGVRAARARAASRPIRRPAAKKQESSRPSPR